MSALIKLVLSKINWSAIAGAILGLAGVIFGLFRNEQAKSAEAEAAQKVAEKDAEVAKANSAAQQRATDAVVAVKEAKEEVAKIPDDGLDDAGRELGIVRD